MSNGHKTTNKFKEEVDDYIVLRAWRLSRDDCAQILKVGTSTLMRWEHKNDFPEKYIKRGGVFTKKRCLQELLASRLAQNLPLQSACDELGITVETAEKWTSTQTSRDMQKHYSEVLATAPKKMAAQKIADEEELWQQQLEQAKAPPPIDDKLKTDVILIKVKYAMKHILEEMLPQEMQLFSTALETNTLPPADNPITKKNEAAANTVYLGVPTLFQILHDGATTAVKTAAEKRDT